MRLLCISILCLRSSNFKQISAQVQESIALRLLMAHILLITATSGTNFELAEKFAENAQSKGHDTEIIDLAEMDLPMFTVARSKGDGAPDVTELITKMTLADAWVVIAPEYNGSVPPTLNNAIAWMSTDWKQFRTMCTGKPVGLATHSGGGGAHVIMAMRQQFSFIGADVMGRSCMSGRDKEANPETIDAMIDNLAR
jgi:chromate reductase